MKPFEEDAVEENGKFRPVESVHFSDRWWQINVFLGWMLPGWVGALVWACLVPKGNAESTS